MASEEGRNVENGTIASTKVDRGQVGGQPRVFRLLGFDAPGT